MKINVLIDTWQKNEAGVKEITNPSERPNRVYDVVEGEKVVVIKYGDGAEEFSFEMQDVTDHSVTIQCFQPLFTLGPGSGDLTKFTIEEGKETILDTASKDFGFRFTVTLVKGGAIEGPTEGTPMTGGSEEEKKKLTTSVQFNFSAGRLLSNVYNRWDEFNSVLGAGPASFKEYLVKEWNKLKSDLLADPNIELKDVNKEVTVNDFDITINKTKKNTPVFFITLPDYDYRDASGKFIALALTDYKPRYFALEYSEEKDTHKPAWVIGELRIENKDIQHRFVGVSDNMRMTWFAGYILSLLDAENL